MKALVSLVAYLITGMAGIGIAAYASSFLLKPGIAEEELKISPTVHSSLKAKGESTKSPRLEIKVDEQIRLAQTEVNPPVTPNPPATPNPTATPNPSQENEPQGQSDIVVEGQKKKELDLRFLQDSFEYEPKGKRDPFLPYQAPTAVIDSAKPIGPVKPLQKFAVEQLRVQGIIWGVEEPIAMVEAPNKKIYYVREREKIGNNNGYVAQIREGEVVIVESFVHRGNITSQVKVLPLDKTKK